MVATLAPAGRGRWRYYFSAHETKDALSVWWDEGGAKAIGLEGVVDPDQYRNLYHGFSPDGRKALVNGAGSKGYRPGFDLCLLAPKSVSIAWALASTPEVRAEIEAAFDAAVRHTLRVMNERCGLTRRTGENGIELEKVGLIVARFRHLTSRTNDPLLHEHLFVHNLCVREDGSTGTLTAYELYRHKMALGAIFRCELAEQLRTRLGFQCQRATDEKGRPLSWFEIAGITREQVEHFSSRSAEIKRVLGEGSFAGALAAEAANLLTRKVQDLVPLSTLFPRWRAQGEEVGLHAGAIEALTHTARPRYDQDEQVEQAGARALKRLTERQAHFAERDLLRFAAEEAQAMGVGAAQVAAHVTTLLHSSKLQDIGVLKSEHRYATPETVKQEKVVLDAIDRLKAPRPENIPLRAVTQVLKKHPEFGAEEVAAFKKLVLGEGQIHVLDGLPGTGKTSVLKAVAETYKKSFRPIIGCAISGKAARGLEAQAGIKSHTIFKLLRDLEEPVTKRILPTVTHHAHQMVRAAVKKPTRSPKPRVKLPKGSVLVVDESSMVSTATMNRLLRAAEKKNVRLILVGDQHQIQPVDGASPFGQVRKTVPASTLSEIRRQTNPEDRQNVRHFAAGEAKEALSNIQSRGLLTVSEDRLAALEDLITQWKEVGVSHPKENVIIANTNAEVRALNERAQAERLKARALGARWMTIEGQRYYVRDRILCTMNSALGVRNGDMGSIIGFDYQAGKRAVIVYLDETKTKVRLPVRSYGKYLSHGYAASSTRLQGTTLTNTWVLAGGALQDRQSTTVQASRHRHSLHMVTDKYEAGEKLETLISKASNDREKTMAHEVIQAVVPTQER